MHWNFFFFFFVDQTSLSLRWSKDTREMQENDDSQFLISTSIHDDLLSKLSTMFLYTFRSIVFSRCNVSPSAFKSSFISSSFTILSAFVYVYSLSIAVHNPGEWDDLAREHSRSITINSKEIRALYRNTHPRHLGRKWSWSGNGEGMNKRRRNTMILMTENAIVASRMVRRGSSRVVLNGIIRWLSFIYPRLWSAAPIRHKRTPFAIIRREEEAYRFSGMIPLL